MLAAQSISSSRQVLDQDKMGYWMEVTVNYDDNPHPAVSRDDIIWATNLLNDKVLWKSFKANPESRMAKYVALKLGQRVFSDAIISIKVTILGEVICGEFALQRESIDVLQPEETNGTIA